MSALGGFLFSVLSVTWGIPYLMIKVAVEEVSVPMLGFARAAIGAALLLPLAISRSARALLIRYWKPVAAFGFVEIIAAGFLWFDAERHLSSALTALLIAATPILTAILVRLTSREQPLGAAPAIGLGVGLAGVAVLAGPGLRGGDGWPVTEALLAALCYAIAALIADRYLTAVPATTLTAACLGLAALVYLPPALLTWPQDALSGRTYLAIAGLAVVCTALSFVVFFALIREVGPVRSTVALICQPGLRHPPPDN